MPEEIEDVAEISIELAKENAENHGGPKWVNHSALSSMIMAMILAITALFAGLAANDSLISRLNENTDLIKANKLVLEKEILLNRIALLKGVDGSVAPDLEKNLMELQDEASELLSKAPEELKISDEFLHVHEIFAFGATILSVAISMTGMAIAIRRKKLWYVALIIGFVGGVVIVNGFFRHYFIE